jgi:DHA2 family multidrug resistance protein
VDALHRSYKLLEGAIDTQASLWSYIDDFRYLALLCFATVPIAFALKKVSSRKAVAAH